MQYLRTIIMLIGGYICLTFYPVNCQTNPSINEKIIASDYLTITYSIPKIQSNNPFHVQPMLVTSKHKRKKIAYDKLLTSFSRIVSKLVRTKMVPSESSIIAYKIRQKYIKNHHLYVYERVFVLYGKSDQVQYCIKKIRRLGVTKFTSTSVQLAQMADKFLILRAFHSLKETLDIAIDKLQTYEDFIIHNIIINGPNQQTISLHKVVTPKQIKSSILQETLLSHLTIPSYQQQQMLSVRVILTLQVANLNNQQISDYFSQDSSSFQSQVSSL